MPTSGLYVKKPIPTSAVQWFKIGDHPGDVNSPYREYGGDSTMVVDYYSPRSSTDDLRRECEHCGLQMRDHGWIKTLEGGHIVCPSDWIMTGIDGEHWPVKASIFERTYERVGDLP